jgi:hypothetical protein
MHSIDRETTRKYLMDQISFILNFIDNLQKDLQSKIEDQKLIVNSSKSDLDSSIPKNIKYSYMAELQKARLDRQIEQFEELQKRLIKI